MRLEHPHGWHAPVGAGVFGSRAIPVTAGPLVVYRRAAWRVANGVFLVLFAAVRRRRARITDCPLVASALICLSLLGWSLFSPQSTTAALEKIRETARFENGTLARRLVMWRSTLDLIVQRPLLGWGEDTFLAEFPQVRPLRMLQLEDYRACPEIPHNHWLYLARAERVPALALYLVFLAALAIETLTIVSSRRSDPRAVVAAASTRAGSPSRRMRRHTWRAPRPWHHEIRSTP